MNLSNEENVDIVNDKGEVIGKTTKSQAHTQNILHQTVIAELIDSDSNWLLVKQASDKQDAGQFVSPVGGHVRAGETAIVALLREVKEEIGLEKFDYKYVGKSIFRREILNRKENHLFVVYEIYSDEEVVLNKESVSFNKLSKNKLQTMLKTNPNKFGDAFHFVWKTFYQKEL